MKIREKLTLQFCAIVGLIFIVFSFSIFYVSKIYRYNAFKSRLKEKALNTAKLLIEVEEIDLNLLKELRRNYFQSLPDEFVRVYDQRNNPIFKDDSVSYKMPRELLEEVRENGNVDFSHGDRQFVAIRYKNNYVIVASARNIYGKQELENLAFILFLANLIGILVIFIAGRFFAKQALKPVSKMIEDVDNIGESNLSSRLDEGKKKDELSQLAMTFNRLFGRIEEAFDRQKRFVSNASHELRTPLTTITGEIEVALMKGRTQEQYEQVLLSVQEEARTLTNLSNDLLRLTQTNDIKGLIVEKISMNELLQFIVEENYKRNSQRVLQTKFSNDVKNMFISGNKELLKIALMNVVDNGYKFSKSKPVQVSVYNDQRNIYLSIKDQGIGMSEEEISFVFQPFYRSVNVASIPGSGVGLSLTEKIIKLHGGRIEIVSEPGNGTEVISIFAIEK